ncbi:hypothetical protein MYX82_10085 [Acidobacteria bacterium AH-259-D05]|nr:hypothetical protein [Acidobacteria bacterium AH-259-D05]
MVDRPPYDTIIKGVRVVRPRSQDVDVLDLAVREGTFARIGPEISSREAERVFDDGNLLARISHTCSSRSGGRAGLTRRATLCLAA